jgi:hypothetical protein
LRWSPRRLASSSSPPRGRVSRWPGSPRSRCRGWRCCSPRSRPTRRS